MWKIFKLVMQEDNFASILKINFIGDNLKVRNRIGVNNLCFDFEIGDVYFIYFFFFGKEKILIIKREEFYTTT